MISRKKSQYFFREQYKTAVVLSYGLLAKDVRMLLLPNRAGNNKIITPQEENSSPCGLRPRGKELTSFGVIILLLPFRLGKNSTLLHKIIAQ